MKQYIALVTLHANLEIVTFLNVLKWFVFWVRQFVANYHTRQRQSSAAIGQMFQFLQHVEVMMSENFEKSIMATDDQLQVTE